MTVSYLRDTAMQAGLETHYLDLETIGWNYDRQIFVDEREQPIRNCFKLYPWEWMVQRSLRPATARRHHALARSAVENAAEQQGDPADAVRIVPEQPVSAAGRHSSRWPAITSASRSSAAKGPTCRWSGRREFQFETEGNYGGPFVYQSLCTAAGIRRQITRSSEAGWSTATPAASASARTSTPVTQNTSRFVPHVFGP